MSDHTCPRCLGSIPNDKTPGAYPGALSRADDLTEVCSACGVDEAMKQWLAGGCEPVEDWPVTDKHRVTRAIEAALKEEASDA